MNEKKWGNRKLFIFSKKKRYKNLKTKKWNKKKKKIEL